MLDTNTLTAGSDGKFTIYAFGSTWAAKNVKVQDTQHQFKAISIVDYEKL